MNEPEHIAEKIINSIIYDISDRRGLKHEWNSIDADVQQEIRDEWKRLILEIFEEPND